MKTNKEPTQQRAINTRSAILEAAFESFKKNGYKKTNTINIAKSADVSIGIVYSYFKDKDELLDLWLDSFIERSDNYFYNQLKLLSYDVEFDLIVSNILDKAISSFFSSPIVEEMDKNDYLSMVLTSFYTKIGKILIKCLYDNSIYIKNPNEIIHIIVKIIYDYSRDLCFIKKSINIDVLKEKYIKIIVSLLKN